VGDVQSPFARRPQVSLGPQFFVKRLVPEAQLPVRCSADAAGYDLFSSEPTSMIPGERRCVSTGLSMAIPKGYYGRVAPRSGLAVKNGLTTGAGVIDSDYRGEVRVLLFNHGQQDVHLPASSRIAQLILEKITTPDVIEVDDLDATTRGVAGFGSTGS
jgi:dUTP pyrophosphatase